MFKIYDISMSIYEGMTVYKNKAEKQPRFQRLTNDYVSETRIYLDVHCGTHVDAPLHMIPGGQTIDQIALERVVRPCRVIDLTHAEDGIGRQDLERQQIEADEFLLLKTKNSYDQTFNPDFVYLKEDGARYLLEKKISGVGIDALGVERSQPGHPTHKTLFSNDIVVIEGLRLRDVEAGNYLLIAAPLKIVGVDASPARALLLDGFPSIER